MAWESSYQRDGVLRWSKPRSGALASLMVAILVMHAIGANGGEVFALKPGNSPLDNPFKGLVPYSNPPQGRFPHSMEFSYLPLGDLVIEENQYKWDRLEALLDSIASRGNQAVFRIYMEYPGKSDGVPAYLVKRGVKIHKYLNTNTQPFPPQQVETPDYNDPQLQTMLRDFIKAMGARYDGDPRIAYITAGLLGTWGEWHTFPREELWASKKTQRMVLDAYEQSFKQTAVLLRYPAASKDSEHIENASRPFGFHDDSFAWATLMTNRPADDWFFLDLMDRAGKQAREKWKRFPIGGEIRPELWGKIFDAQPGVAEAQDFGDCVRETHVTWLMDSGLFQSKPSDDRYLRAAGHVRRMGYDLHIAESEIEFTPTKQLLVRLQVLNQGVAPLYRHCPIEMVAWNRQGEPAGSWILPKISFVGIMPDEKRDLLVPKLDADQLPTGPYRLTLRGQNPLSNGKPLRFANQEQDRDFEGWLTIGTVVIP